MPPDVCPNCGAVVPHNAKVCPGCGSDESTGWSETGYVGKLGLPDEGFDYGDFVKKEFGSDGAKPRGISWLWWLVALLLLGLFLYSFLH